MTVQPAHSRIFISLGSNLGDRFLHIETANEMIERKIGRIVARSSLYETEPVGVICQPPFLNQVIEMRSALGPVEVLESCLSIEREMGRVRNVIKGPRVIDLDLIYYGSQRVRQTGASSLDVPHPRATSRRFVLEPLAEIAPDFIDPACGRTIASLLADLPPVPRVDPWQGPPAADRVSDT